MKSISKVLSMILVVVMCFGLFTTSAFATAMANFDFSGSGNNTAQNSTAGGGFDFNPAGSSNSASNGGGFDFGGQQSQPVNFDPQPAATTVSGNTTTVTNSLSTGDSATFGKPYPGGTSWQFHTIPEVLEFEKSTPESDAAFTIYTTSDSDGFDSDSFPGGFGYSTKTNGEDMHTLTQGVHYSITKNNLKVFGSFVKTLPVGVYYFFGLDSTRFPTQMARLTINSGDFGQFNIGGSPYNKNADNPPEIFADSTGSKMGMFVGFGLVGVSDPGFRKILTVNTEYTKSNDNRYVYLKTSLLNNLADGTYKLVGFTTAGEFNADQVVIGEFIIESQASQLGDFYIINSPYDKSKPVSERESGRIGAHTDDAAAKSKMASLNYSISGPETRALSVSDLSINTVDGTVMINRTVLDSLADGTYTFTATYTSGIATVTKTLGQFTITSGSIQCSYTINNSPYDKSKENDGNSVVYASAKDEVSKAWLPQFTFTVTGVSSSYSHDLSTSEFAIADGNTHVGLTVDYLNSLPDGTYNLLGTAKAGATTAQVVIGQFVITTGTIDVGQFLIKGSPYDKDADHMKEDGTTPDPAAVSATALTAGMMGKLSDFAISGVGSINPPRKFGVGEYYTQGDTFAIDNKVLDALDDGSYYIVATAKVGTSSQQVTLGIFNVTSGGVDYGFQIHYSPYDKNKADHTAIVATAKNDANSKAKGIMARMSSFAIATGGTFSTGTYANIQTLSPSDYTIDSANNGITIHNNVLDALEDGNYILLGSLTTGNVTQQLTIGGFTIISGDVKFGTTFIFENIYDKNDKDRKAVYGGVKGDFDARLKLSDFSINGVSDATFSQALSVNQYTYTDGAEKKIELSKDVLDALPDGIYNLMCTATIGNVTKTISIGSFTIKSGNVDYGTPHIGNPLFDKNDEKRQIVYAWVADADERFEMGNFVISGVTYPSINQTLSGSQYSMEGKTKVNLSMDVLDTLPDGDYNLLCTATVGNAKIQMTLGMFTVVSGKIDYGTYVIYGSPYDKNANPAPEFYAQATAIDKMTKMTGFAITGITNPTFNRVLSGSEYARNDWSVTISESVLDSLPDGDYNLIGFATVLKNSAQVNMGKFTVVSNYGNFEVFNSPYDKNDKHAQAVFVTAEKKADMQKMTGFGVAAVNGSYVQALSVNNYYRSSDGYSVVLEESYLDTLTDGQYYLIGFPTYGSTAEQVILGTFIIRSGGIEGNARLTPDGQVWYSGSDPLTFYSEIHDLAGKGWNYKPYDWGNIVPDIRVSTYSDMRSPTSVRIDQYWDLNYGYIMLGANFLNSLSAEHTYYMQVIDARDPEGLYSDVVSFRVGPTLRALDTDKHVINSTRSLRFRSSEPISRVYVGNIELTDPADFGISWDGRTVTLSFEFLNKRTGGNTYTIKVLTTGGEYASTTFQVLTTAQGSASPRTGDESNLGLWAAFLLLSGTAIVVMVPKLKKHDF